MRHLKRGRKFGRKKNRREAFLDHMVTAFFEHGKILTTEARAKELRPIIERCITHARRGGISKRRQLLQHMPPVALKRVVEKIVPRYQDRSGGYIRIIRIERRKSDAASRAILELV